MDTMIAVLGAAVKGGWRTSEFWLTALAVVLPYAAQSADNVQGTPGVVAKVGVAAAGAAASAYYSISRAKVKAATVAAAAEPASAEVAHAIANGDTATATIGGARR